MRFLRLVTGQTTFEDAIHGLRVAERRLARVAGREIQRSNALSTQALALQTRAAASREEADRATRTSLKLSTLLS